MNKFFAIFLIIGIAFSGNAAPAKKQTKGLSSILNLLPQGEKSLNVLNSLGFLTQGTPLGTITQAITLLNQLHLKESDIDSFPQDVTQAFKQLQALLGGQVDNISNILNQIQQTKDLSSILNLLPQGENSIKVLKILGLLTQGTPLGTIIIALTLINQLHLMKSDIASLPQDIIQPLNQLEALLGPVDNILNILNPQ
ncbi:unnamed protein product [Brachionus calyciflorus]|uniref:Uncharacterized protein n=1 Tax=Brachionus calyciflorus TaxID=104777 RepID=A0A813ZMC4_9BILA|nr:unnamed protein product [Brachionus calyciflorus]